MAKTKVVNNNLDQNLNGNYFTNTPSQTIFSFGGFYVTSNFDNRKYIDYSNTLSSFVRAVTLDTMGVNDVQSEIVHNYNTNAVLNLDKSDLNTFIRFGSAYEFLRVSIQNIIIKYPSSLFISSQYSRGGNVTFFDYKYDMITNTSIFKVPVNYITNTFGHVYNYGNVSVPDDNIIKNLNLSYEKYIIWTTQNPINNSSTVLGYTGNTTGRNYLTIKAQGNPFSMVTNDSAPLDFHIKPNNEVFEEYRQLLNEYEKHIISSRDETNGFKFTLKDPTLLEDGNITYTDSTLLWTTGDKYNLDINTPNYQKFLEILLTIGAKYDKIKTDLIARFLTPTSLKAYDLTEEGKMTKLLRIYGREFDQLREFIDSLVYINRVSYDKVNNVPDQLVRNLSRTFGWNYFSLVNEQELVNSFLTIDENERDLNKDLLPAEIDIELWRRILINTNYFWKSKGTRQAIKSMFLLIGIPEPFINITEYVYTVDGKINPNSVQFNPSDFPSNSLPYDTDGYPVAPKETNDFYFQISGDTDSGQAYMNVFRNAGFNLMRTIDNKKSWSEAGAIYRNDDTTPQYFQKDSKLVLNTKEVDISLDTARGIEYDVYQYILKDFAVNSSGYTLPYTFVNISLGVGGSQNTFTLPASPSKVYGDFEVRFNGILLNAPKTGTTTGITTQADYTIDYSTNTFTISNGIFAQNNSSRRDVIQATYIYSGGTSPISDVTIQYVVTRVKANVNGTVIPLPSLPRGDVQLTINGIALTKGTPQFVADYIVDPNNTSGSSQIIIQNTEVITYLQSNPEIQVAYVDVVGTNGIAARSEIWRVDSFNTGKFYFNQSANKFIYKLNYKANKASDVKVLINGIALEPDKDYTLNVQNPYELFLPNGIKYGTVISIYYLVATEDLFKPIIPDYYGLGDISQLSFLEFIELIQRKMVNVRNRKTISDFKGGWYPALLKIYVEYMKRSTLPSDNPLLSNGYTFTNLYSFLSKYNSFFQRFVDDLLSATIILRKGGLLVRNTVFTKQKFMYRRGVNLYSNDMSEDMRGNIMLQYRGDDGAVFMITQPEKIVPPILYVDTVAGGMVSLMNLQMGISTGGMNVLGSDVLTEYGIQYRIWLSDPYIDSNANLWSSWNEITKFGMILTDNFPTIISGVTNNTLYEFRAFVRSGVYGYTGNTLQFITPAISMPEIHTKLGIVENIISPDDINNDIPNTTNIAAITNTGGYNIVQFENIEKYGMQYRPIGKINTNIFVSPSTLNYPLTPSALNIKVSGESFNTYTIVKNPSLGWISPAAPVIPTPTGTVTNITVKANSGAARSGVVCYVPKYGYTKCVTVNQASGLPVYSNVSINCYSGNTTSEDTTLLGWVTANTMTAGQCYSVKLNWSIIHGASPDPLHNTISIYCNDVTKFNCVVSCKNATNKNGSTPTILVKDGDKLKIKVYADSNGIANCSEVRLSTITSGIGYFQKGTPDSISAEM